MSLKEVLASFSHIELNEEELDIAILEAKRRKDAILKEKARAERAELNRKALTARHWTFEQTKMFMLNRANELFDGKFIVDEHNEKVFDLLCYYFSYDPRFIDFASKMKVPVPNPSLDKGILLAGNFGTGKTWLMSLFRKNNRQVYHVEHAKLLAKAFRKGGLDAMEKHCSPIKNNFNDPVVLYQPLSGLCIEDIGREDIKNDFGNKENVIGDIMETRYINKCMGNMFHGTTNLTVEQMGGFYGEMLRDRFRECLNLIELGGPSRRK